MKNLQPNHLKNEKSPYLIQHAHNPVDWYPWSEEALVLAKAKNKPIFLSIGYATCHWCHVMEKESFEDNDVAMLMNKSFVNIKVDREERPDIDAVYMKVCQMINGSGGWPLTIIMFPDKRPFFAGTYIPKTSFPGRIGMIDLINKVNALWVDKPDDLEQSAEYITTALNRNDYQISNTLLDETILDTAYSELASIFDQAYGGFGNSPKFPVPHNLTFLLKYQNYKNKSDALKIVEKTLTEMRKGGIWDHIGFGFHRYSTDSHWLLPHFEKMLYDQAQLMKAYSLAYDTTKNADYLSTAIEIAEYIHRDLTSPEGAFYSAEDADSEGIEGKFYVWNKKEVESLLGEDSKLFADFYNIHQNGNFSHENESGSHEQNIPHQNLSLREFAREFNLDTVELKQNLENSINKLYMRRENRIHPLKDDKILTDWNGLAISSLVSLYKSTRNKKFLNIAMKSADFFINSMCDPLGQLFHRYREGERAIEGMLDDYVFLINGLISLYYVTFDPKYLLKAIELQSVQDKYFWDNDKGGYFLSSSISEIIISRQKEIYDGAIPSGNSISFGNLIYFSRISDKSEFRNKITKMIQVFGAKIKQAPSYYTSFLANLYGILYPGREIIIYSNDNLKDKDIILEKINESGRSDIVILLDDTKINSLSREFPHLLNYKMIGGKTTVYICKNFACEKPETDIEIIISRIEAG